MAYPGQNPMNPVQSAVTALTAADKALTGATTSALKDVMAALAEVGKVVKAVTEPALLAMANTLKNIVAPATKVVTAAYYDMADGLKSLARSTVSAGASLYTSFKDVMGKLVGAVSGPLAPLIGHVTAALKPIGSAFEKVLTPLGDIIERNLKPITGKFGNSVKEMFDVESTLKPITRTLAPATRATADMFKGLAGSFAVATGAAVGLGYAIGQFVKMASPAHFELFQQAVNDLLATIGQALIPIFNLVIDIVRSAGDTLGTFVSSIGGAIATVLKPLVEILKVLFEVFGHVGQMIGKMMEAAAPALAAIGQAFLAVVQAVQPIVEFLIDVIGGALTGALKLLASALEFILPPIIAFIQVLGDMVKWVMGKVRDFLVFLGLIDEEKPGTEKGKSRGMAARQASTTSIDSVLQKARESAFSLGTASAEDPKLAVGKSIDTKVAEIRDAILDLPRRIGEAVKSALDPTKSDSAIAGAVAPGAGMITREMDARMRGAEWAAKMRAIIDKADETARAAGAGAGAVVGGAP